MSFSNSIVLRAWSVSSRRRMNVPPTCRAWRKLKSAVRAVPMWSGPVGLGAIRTRTVAGGHPATRSACGRHLVEQARIGLARQDADERRGPQAEGRPAARSVERERVERLRAGEDRDMGARRQRPGLEVGEQAGVLLGLLGDPVDGRPLAGLDLAQADAGRPSLRGLGIDRVAMGARLGMAEHLVESGLDARRDGALEAHRLVVGLGPAEADRPSSAAIRAARAGGRSRRRRPARPSSGEAHARRPGRRGRPRRGGGTSRWRPGWSRRDGGRSGRP